MSNDKKPVKEFGGKSLDCFKGSQKRISVPLNSNYRLILKEVKNGLEPEFVGSHDKYEKWIRIK